jgi:hypothetical protein
MTRKSDISTPEGYFENLQERLLAIPVRQTEATPSTTTKIRRFAPYLAYAASLALLLAVGTSVLRKTATTPAVQEDPYWDYVAYLSDALDPDGYFEYVEAEPLSDEDIVNYLLASNVSLEQLAMSYEEGF